MSKQGGTTKTVSNTAPAAFQQPYIDQMLSEAKKLYGADGPKYYEGNTVAGFTQPETQAQGQILSQVAPTMQGLSDKANASFADMLKSYDVANNPVVANAANAAIRPVMNQLNETTLPSLRGGAMLTGGLGGSRQGIAEGLATGKAAQAAMDTSAGIYNNAYNSGLSATISALGQLPTLQSGALAPAAVTSDVGAQQRDMNQQNINADITKWMYNQNLPYTKLAEYANIVKNPLGGSGTAEVTEPTAALWQQILGAGMSAPAIIAALQDLFGGN